MKKMTTLFKKDPNDLGRVINEVDPLNEWALTKGVVTIKRDGTACAVIDGLLYKRFDLKKGRTLPLLAIPCQEPDLITGHHPHWVPCIRDNPADKYHWEAWDRFMNAEGNRRFQDGTYELCGPKVNGNHEQLNIHVLIKHGNGEVIFGDVTYESIQKYLLREDIEGYVFHHPDGRMCKIRKKDFGMKRGDIKV